MSCDLPVSSLVACVRLEFWQVVRQVPVVQNDLIAPPATETNVVDESNTGFKSRRGLPLQCVNAFGGVGSKICHRDARADITAIGVRQKGARHYHGPAVFR